MLEQVQEKFRELEQNNGRELQALVVCEECAEFIQALSKTIRNDTKQTRYALLEEYADVLLMLEQVKQWYGFTEDEVGAMLLKKINKLMREER